MCTRSVRGNSIFKNVFDFQLLDQKGDFIAAMTDGHGFTLVLSNLRSDQDEVDLYPKDFHLGFYVETMTEIDQFYTKLAAAGIESENEPGMIRGVHPEFQGSGRNSF